MSSSKKTPAADRSHGGPGSSRQDATQPEERRAKQPAPGEPTNSPRSRISGGGGERDIHHTHDPATKA
jgi:hypothetical protein